MVDYNVGIAGVNLKTTIGVREAQFTKYTSAQKRGGNLIIPYQHGELHVPDKYFSGADVLLRVFLPFDTTAAAQQALSDIAELLASQTEVPVTQDDPARGSIQAQVEALQDPIPTTDRFTYLFSLRNASGFWEDQTLSNAPSGNPPSVTTGGDRPIDDMILTFSGPGFIEYTDELGVDSRITVDAAAGAGTYIVDVGAATIEKGGTPQDEFLTVNQPWWMKWPPNEALTLTTDVGVEVDWRNKWA